MIYSKSVFLNSIEGSLGPAVLLITIAILNATEVMSNKFSTTTASFGNSNLFRPEKQEELIREIAQNEFLELFDEIKVEIETKIKSIDKNII